MSGTCVFGTGWGDEGKGGIVDLLTQEADIVVRTGGGANAGHTVVVGDDTFKMHLIPCGILHKGTHCVITNGLVLDLGVLTGEIDSGRPLVFLVDTNADGYADHFVTVVGYRDPPDWPTQQYGCLDTWPPAAVVRWCDFSAMAVGQSWGVWGGWTFGMGGPFVLAGSLSGGELVLSWTVVAGAIAYSVYGADNGAYFEPGLVPPYQHRLAILSPGWTSWSIANGIGDPDSNWTYLLVAVDYAGQELERSNRVGQFDWDVVTSP